MTFKEILFLLVAAKAPTPGPTPDKDYPKYPGGGVPATGGDLSNSKYVKETYNNSGTTAAGLYRAYRNKMLIFPTQTLTAGNTATNQAVAAPSTGSRTFWQFTTAHLGNYPPEATTVSNIANGAVWMTCLDTKAATNAECNGGVGKSSSADHVISKRIVAQAGVSTAISLGGGSSDVFIWNEDLLMASMYHPMWIAETTDGTRWCSTFSMTLSKDGVTTKTATATQGLNGKSKCTWQFVMEDGSKGPTIRLVSANSINFLFFWMEWLNSANLGTGAFLADVGGANYQLGDYPAADGLFFNPLKSVTPTDTKWVNSAISWAVEEKAPSERFPGSLGDAIYMSRASGIFGATQTVKVDSAFYLNLYSYYSS